MVKWNRLEKQVVGLKSDAVEFDSIMAARFSGESPIINVETTSRQTIGLDLGPILDPNFGSYWRTLYKHNDMENLKASILNYYQYKDKPQISCNILEFKDGESLLINKRIVKGKTAVQNFLVNDVIAKINDKVTYDEVVVGHDGNNVEMQFLVRSKRVEVSAGDLIDPGIFVNVNGKVRVSAGVNQLICTNGLVRNWFSVEAELTGDINEFVDQAVVLMNWFRDKNSVQVCSVSELMVVLNTFPRPLINKFLEIWAKGVEDKTLTWYRVISDVTNYANSYLNNTRLKLLEVSNNVKQFEETHNCPTCKTVIA